MSEAGAETENNSTVANNSEKPFRVVESGKAVSALWKAKLSHTGKNGPIRRTLANALIPLRLAPEWQGVLFYNAFSHVIELHKAPPWESASARAKVWENRAWSDYDDMMLTEWLQKAGIDIQTRIAADATFVVAKENSYHPVQSYLRKLRWDGKPRIDKWLSTYLGAEDTAYHSAIGKRWLISGIARILDPGQDCKADCVLILEGEQGYQKSTALKTLSAPWFLDDLRQFGSKDAAMKISGRWIVELAELTGMNEITIEACKAFFSQVMDCFRPPYGRRVIDAPRQCIFAASTNKNIFLKDETGDRRYWPVTCGPANIDLLKATRDQLWAEAMTLFEQGHPWWLETPELRALAEEEQRMRFDADPWERSIRSYLRAKAETTPEDILDMHFGFEIEDVSKILRNRVSSILRHLKWQRVRTKTKEHRDEYVWVRTEKSQV